MIDLRKLAAACGAASLAILAVCGSAAADGYEEYAAPPPAEEGRKFTYSFNLAATNDYIFRGYSQSSRDPVPQGGVDITWGLLYAGIWASGVDFGGPLAPGDGFDAQTEIDYYAGITPSWGPANFDFAVLYYTYPAATDFAAELDYVELKAGVSGDIAPKLNTGLTVYWSPEYTGATGSVWTLEGAASYEFHKVAVFTPIVSGTLGYQTGDNAAWKGVFANGSGSYTYWNAGLELGVENLTFDFRYWDTNVSNAGGFCTGTTFQCDAAFSFTAKVAVP